MRRPGRAVRSIAVMRRRMRVMAALAAACLCMVAAAGGTYTYRNGKVDSVIGIDVNPSVELSVNRKNRVLEAEPLNEDAKAIMEDMNLKGVDLNVAVNAVIGSMVTHGYLDDLDNAILVTVSNDSISKASALRSSVVNDIQSSLEENQVKAVVYDQQVIEEDDVKALADDYRNLLWKSIFPEGTDRSESGADHGGYGEAGAPDHGGDCEGDHGTFLRSRRPCRRE